MSIDVGTLEGWEGAGAGVTLRPRYEAVRQARDEVPARADGQRFAHSAPRAHLRRRLVAIDLFSIALAWPVLATVGAVTPRRMAATVLAAGAVLVVVSATGLYRARVCARRSSEVARLALASMSGVLVLIAVGWLARFSTTTEAAAGGAVCFALLSLLRWHYARWLRDRRGAGEFLRNVIVVGTNSDTDWLCTMLRTEPELGYRVTGVVGDVAASGVSDGALPSSSIEDLPRLLASSAASGVVLVGSALTAAEMQRALQLARQSEVHVQLWPGLRGVSSRRLRHVPMSGELFFYVEAHSVSRWQAVVKRAIDVVLGVGALVISAPTMVAVALLIKLHDRGPVLHKGTRVGLNGSRFAAYKFRTMVPDASSRQHDIVALNERTDGPLFKATNDPRVTKIGRVLRATSLDELPQLFNVLAGTMSLVGPRPALPDEVEKFDDELLRRHAVRPGITGLWQVEARDNPSFHAYRRLDLAYVDNWSVALDLGILATTLHAVVARGMRSVLRVGRPAPD